MKRTSVLGLAGVGVFVAAAVAIIMPRVYGYLYAIPVSVSVTLWVMAVLCLTWARKVRAAKEEDARGIGLDNSQLNPMTVMNYMLVGRASAFTGTVVGAGYAGVATYVVPRMGELAAAQADTAGVIASMLGGLAMAAAGVYLERNCEVPPPADGISPLGTVS